MGCDIHCFVEVFDGEWKNLCEVNINRNYLLFAQLANVRNYNENNYLEPNGLPEIGPKYDFEDDCDYHSTSHRALTELEEFYKNNQKIKCSGMISPRDQKALQNGILPDRYCRYTWDKTWKMCDWEIPNSPMFDFIETIKDLTPDFDSDKVRVVYTFDN